MFISIDSKNFKLHKLKFSLLGISALLLLQLFFACKSTEVEEVIFENSVENIQSGENIQVEEIFPQEIEEETEVDLSNNQISLMFAGDIMAHTQNYIISEYSKIYRDVKDLIEPVDLAFANIEAPFDTSKPASSYPNFNMTKKYVCAAVDAGFDVFSLCNNHTNDQGLEGILETIKTSNQITKEYAEKDIPVYFSGTKNSSEADFTYNLIEKKGWKILFLPITELLNSPQHSSYINFVKTDDKSRKEFASYIKNLRENNPCDLFILSLHTSEPEYTRVISERQRNYYLELLDAGADIIMANHAHIVKDREFVYNSKNGSQKLIMYANGNVISGQRTRPDFASKYPDFERDNTGDGLFFYVTYQKDPNNPQSAPKIVASHKQFITTYINTANEYVLKKLNEDFVKYLYEVPRTNWAEYIKRRIKIDNTTTKDLITWQ